jgi:predicted component of type VI protein secretion system
LANLPKGYYQIIAEYNDSVKQQWVKVVDINNKKNQNKKSGVLVVRPSVNLLSKLKLN